MMKNIFLIFLIAVGLNGFGQATSTDPAVGSASFRDPATGASVAANALSNLAVVYRLPVRNLSPSNPLPPGSTAINIFLGSNLRLDPSFNVTNARLNQYYTWTSTMVGGQVQITGTQKNVPVPAFFFDSTEFRVYGSSVGPSTVTASIDPITSTIDDINPNNNSNSLNYIVVSTVLPSKLTQFNVVRTGCNIDVNFVAEEQTNVSRYNVEVSKDGSSFVTLGDLAATASSRYNVTYPITNAIKSASLFVRLKTVDNDGRIEYSSVRMIAGNCDAKRSFALGVYPNPVRFGKAVTINAREGNFDGKYTISLMDIAGRTLQTKEMQLNNVSNFKLDIGNLSSGQYLVRVSTADFSESAVVGFQKQ